MPLRRNIQRLPSRISKPQSSIAPRPETARPILRVLLDAGVPDSVGELLQKRGHFVILHRSVLADSTPDEVVCATALANDSILLAIDPDMKRFPKRYGISHGSPRFATLNLIWVGCNEVMAAKRIEQAIGLIEFEWNISTEKVARRLWVEIGPHHIKSNR